MQDPANLASVFECASFAKARVAAPECHVSLGITRNPSPTSQGWSIEGLQVIVVTSRCVSCCIALAPNLLKLWWIGEKSSKCGSPAIAWLTSLQNIDGMEVNDTLLNRSESAMNILRYLEISWAENHQIYDAWKILSSKPPGKHGRQHTHTIQYKSVNLCATQRRKGARLEELDVLEAVSWYNVQPHASPKCSIGIGWTFPVISWNSGSPLSQETCDTHFLC